MLSSEVSGPYEINICTAHTAISLGLFQHYFIQIPQLQLEIHPGRYKYGTHHTLGFKTNYTVKKTSILCEYCLTQLLTRSTTVSPTWWYYPIINCETLTVGLVDKQPLSIQLLLSLAILTTGIMSIWMTSIWIIAISFLILLLLYNRLPWIVEVTSCNHVQSIRTIYPNRY